MGKAQPFTVWIAQGLNGQLTGIVEWIEGLLLTMRVDFLTKIALLVKQADADHRNAQIAGCLELIAGHVAEAARINWQAPRST